MSSLKHSQNSPFKSPNSLNYKNRKQKQKKWRKKKESLPEKKNGRVGSARRWFTPGRPPKPSEKVGHCGVEWRGGFDDRREWRSIDSFLPSSRQTPPRWSSRPTNQTTTTKKSTLSSPSPTNIPMAAVTYLALHSTRMSLFQPTSA